MGLQLNVTRLTGGLQGPDDVVSVQHVHGVAKSRTAAMTAQRAPTSVTPGPV